MTDTPDTPDNIDAQLPEDAHPETKAIRMQMPRSKREHSTPLYLTSSFVFEDAEQGRALFAEEAQGDVYSRYANPSVRELEQKVAALEGVQACFATATGMAANFAALMTFLCAGDHVVASRALFGGTLGLVNNWLPKWGIEVTLVDLKDNDAWAAAVQPHTKMLFAETPSNPGLELCDLQFLGELASAHELLFAVDNCFATPFLQQPANYGADLIIHSATKYMDGQGRVLGGMVAGSEELIYRVYRFCRTTGPALSPFNAWVISKSLETLKVRLDAQCTHAMALATRLSDHPKVASVRYPFLDSHPQQALAKAQMTQGGGIVTFEVKGGYEQGKQFLDALKMISHSPNLGDVRTICTHPASTTHAKVAEDVRAALGITPGLVRVSLGLEHIDDIWGDIAQALGEA